MGKGSRERPTNLERFGESMDRMYGPWCSRHRRHNCELHGKAFGLGERVYVRDLDVFGRVHAYLQDGRYTVICDTPMPGYPWTGEESWLESAQK